MTYETFLSELAKCRGFELRNRELRLEEEDGWMFCPLTAVANRLLGARCDTDAWRSAANLLELHIDIASEIVEAADANPGHEVCRADLLLALKLDEGDDQVEAT